jgi:hypothetical protein
MHSMIMGENIDSDKESKIGSGTHLTTGALSFVASTQHQFRQGWESGSRSTK